MPSSPCKSLKARLVNWKSKHHLARPGSGKICSADEDGPTQVKQAVIIPVLNEAPTIEKVITDFRRALPEATIVVFDNGSTDGTLEIAQKAGAKTHVVTTRGKGAVVRSMLEHYRADVFVMVDGDDTYDASVSPAAIKKLQKEGLDLLVVERDPYDQGAMTRSHKVGNTIFSLLTTLLFGYRTGDVLSGYRVMSQHFVDNLHIKNDGFGLEIEISALGAWGDIKTGHLKAIYRARPADSHSKLRTLRDGVVVLKTLLEHTKDNPVIRNDILNRAAQTATQRSTMVGVALIGCYVISRAIRRR